MGWERVLARCEFGDCWLWQGSTTNGYGYISIDNRRKRVHRVVWEGLIGSIPDKMVIDHLCRVPNCVNPDHLDVVTHAVNIQRGSDGGRNHPQRRKTVCPQGHTYTGTNNRGERICRTCITERNLHVVA